MRERPHPRHRNFRQVALLSVVVSCLSLACARAATPASSAPATPASPAVLPVSATPGPEPAPPATVVTPLPDAAPTPTATPTLRTAAEVRQTRRELLPAQHVPAEIEGVVTLYHPAWTVAFLQDASGGVYFWGPSMPPDLQPGDRLRIRGRVGAGRFAPILEAQEISRTGRGELPAARAPDPGRLRVGGEDSQRIELSGVVRQVHQDGDSIRWDLAGDLGSFEALFVADPDGALGRATHWVGAGVQLRGVCTSDFNARGQFNGLKLLVADSSGVQRTAAAPEDPFSLPATPLGRVLDFNATARPGRMIRVSGVVTWTDGARQFQIQQGGDGLAVTLAQGPAPFLGDQVEVVGFPSSGPASPELVSARHRRTGSGDLPAPRPLEGGGLNGEADNLLVTTEAVFIDAGNRGQVIEFGFSDEDGRHFSGVAGTGAWGGSPPQLEPGSRVKLVGVYRLLSPPGHQPATRVIRLRGPDDLVPLEAGSWWTRGRATIAAGFLGLAVLGGLLWTLVLNRRLRDQRRELEARMAHQRTLEQRHRELTEGAPDAIFTLDPTGLIHSANPAAAAMVGYSESELRSMRIFEILPADQRARAATRIAERFQLGGVGQPLLIEVLNRAGHRRIVEVASRLLNRPGSPPLLEGVARDVTDRKRAEDALKTLAAMTAPGGGREFCRAVTRQVAELLGIRYVTLATRVPGNPSRLGTLAFFADGHFGPDREFDIAGTPFQRCDGQRECLVPRNARELYPDDPQIQQLGIECFLGIPMWNSRNEPVGVLSLMHTQPFEPSPSQLDMLRVLAARTGAEIERLAATEALRASEERFRQLAEQSEDVLWVLDLRPLRLAYLGASFYRLAGMPPSDTPPTLRQVLRLVHPADRRAMRRRRQQPTDPGGHYSVEFRIVRADGTVRWVFDQGVTLCDSQGRLTRVSGVARDITGRKEAELALAAERSRFHELFENSPDAVFVESLDGVVLDVNRAACDLHRLPRESLVGRHFTDLVPPAIAEEARQSFDRLVSGEATLVEGFSLRADGTSVAVELRVSRFTHRDETALLVHVRDVTRRRAGELFLAGQKRILERIAMARPVHEILSELVRLAENHSPGSRCWVHWFPDQVASEPWIAAASLGSEGLAILRRELHRGGAPDFCPSNAERPTAVVVADADADTESAPTPPPAGEPDPGVPFARLVRELNAGAVVATAIVTPSGRCLGAFGTLCPGSSQPSESDLDLNRLAASLAGVALDRHLADTELREGAERLQTANSALLALARSEALSRGELGTALAEITEAAARSVGVDRVSIWLLEEQDTVLRCLHEFDPGAPASDHAHDLAFEQHRAYFEALTKERQITIVDIHDDPRTAPMREKLLDPLRVRSLLDAGIRLRGRLAGVLCFEHRGAPRQWKAAEELIAASLADIVAMALQASERRCIEEALRQSEEAYRSVVGALAEGVILVSRDGTFLTFNESAAEILGVPSRQLAERRLTDPAWELFHADGTPFGPGENPAILTFEDGRPVTDQPLGVRRPDGKTAWLSVNIRPFNRDAHGEVASVVVSFTDITRRQEAEQGLREGNALLQAITETQDRFIADSDADHTLDRMLATLIRMTASEHGLLAEVTRAAEDAPPALTLHPPRDGAASPDPHLQTAIDTLVGEVLASGSARQLALPGPDAAADSPHHLLALPLRHEDEVVGVVCLGRGGIRFHEELVQRLEPLLVTYANLILAIRTDRRREAAEAQIRQLNAELELRVERRTADLQAINQELAEFAYVVTHDLKAPLRGIHQLSEWLAQDHASQLDASGLRLLSLLRQRVHHLQQLIDGLLACARVGRSPEPERKVQTRDLVKQVLAVLAPPPHVRIHVAEDLPFIEGNPDRLHQVFQNLLDNAVKYLDKPHGRIGVTATRDPAGWTFKVADNGPGIPARYRDKVFQIFQRLHQTAEIPGTGLGLTLVKRIVESRGGKIWIESEDGLGTTVCFTWPDEGRARNLVFGAPSQGGDSGSAPAEAQGGSPTPATDSAPGLGTPVRRTTLDPVSGGRLPVR